MSGQHGPLREPIGWGVVEQAALGAQALIEGQNQVP